MTISDFHWQIWFLPIILFRQAATKILEEAEEIAQLETEAAGGATAVDGTSAEGAEAAQEERAPTEDEEPMNGEEEPAPGTVPAGAFGGTADAEGFFMRKHLSEAGRRASNRYVCSMSGRDLSWTRELDP